MDAARSYGNVGRFYCMPSGFYRLKNSIKAKLRKAKAFMKPRQISAEQAARFGLDLGVEKAKKRYEKSMRGEKLTREDY